MAASIKVGTFTWSGGTSGPQSVTGVGFTPKLLILLAARVGSFGAFSGEQWMSIGYGKGSGASDQFTYHMMSRWNTLTNWAESDAGRRTNEIMSEVGTLGLAAVFKIDSLDADGFTLTATLGDDGQVYSYIAIGGADVQVATGNVAYNTSPGSQAVTGVGFQPSVVWFLEGNTSQSTLMHGWVDQALRQGVSAIHYHDAVSSPSDSDRYQNAAAALAVLNITTGALEGLATVESLDADGFTLDWSSAYATAGTFQYLAVSGITGHAGALTQPAATGTQAVSDLDVAPLAVMFQSTGQAAAAGVADDLRLSLGVGQVGADVAVWGGDVDNVSSDAARRDLRYASAVSSIILARPTAVATGTVDAAARVATLSNGAFELTWTATTGDGFEVLYLALGPAAAVESTVTKEEAWTGDPGDLLLAWVEFYHVDANGDPETFQWAALPVSNTTTYLEPRVLQFGNVERALSDRSGRLEASTCQFTVADTDSAIRAFLGNVNQKALINVEVTIKMQSYEAFLAELELPIVVFRGVVRGYKPLGGHQFAFSCQDWLSARLQQYLAATTVGAAFPGAPVANRDRVGPIWYGRLSDAGSDTLSPTPVAESSSGATGGTVPAGETGVATAGYGLLGGTAPTNLTTGESAGSSEFLSGEVVYIMVTAVHSGVETDPSPFFDAGDSTTISTDTNQVDVAWDDMSADNYRVYIGHLASGQITWDSMVELDGGTLSLAVTSYTNTAGAAATPYSAVWDYTVTAIMADGETAIANRWVAVNRGLRRPMRIVWDPVASAIEYRVYRRPPGGAGTDWDHRWIVPTTQVNGDSDVYFEDSQLDDDPTLAYVDGAPTAEGVVPLIYVGPINDTSGFPWEAFAIAAHAVASIDALFLHDGDDVTKVDSGNYGVTYAAPGKTGFGTYFSSVYHTGADGSRWALVYVRGPDGSDLAAGTKSLRANLDAIEDVGDGTGSYLADLTDQIGHFVDNYALAVTPYSGGNWGSTPTWADGTSKRDTASFTTAADYSASELHTTAGAWGVTESRPLLDVLAELMISADAAYGWSRAGKFRIVLEDPIPTAGATALETFTEEHEIEDQGFGWEDLTDPAYFYNRENYQFGPRYSAGGGVGYDDDADYDDDDSQTEYNQIIRNPQTVAFSARRTQAVVEAIMRRRLDRAKDPPRLVVIPSGLHAVLRELGDVVGITHTEGAGSAGWTGELGMLRRSSLRIDAGQCVLTARAIATRTRADWEIEELSMEYPLGGSLVNSPALDGTTPQTVTAYDPPGADIMVPWSILPDEAVVQFLGQAQVETGITSIEVILWNETGGVQAATSGVITATTLQAFAITVTRPGDTNLEYSLRASVIDGDPALAVHFKAKIRITI